MSNIPRYELIDMREKIEERIRTINVSIYPDSMARRHELEDVLKMIAVIEDNANHGAYNDE
jgi:hypothetical protein